MTERSVFPAALAGDDAAKVFFRGEADRQTLLAHADLVSTKTPLKVGVREAFVAAQTHLPDDPSREDALRRLGEGACVVIAGQQPSLFGGPMLVAYKIATALRLCEMIRASGKDAVAVFWNASEDHDLDEANRLFCANADRSSTRLLHADLEGRGQGLDRIVPAPAMTALRESIASSNLRFRPDEEDWPRPDEDMGRWMGRLWAQRFQGEGLLIIEPRDLAELAVEPKLDLIQRDQDLRVRFEEVSAELEAAGFKAQLEALAAGDLAFLAEDAQGSRKRLKRDLAYRIGADTYDDEGLAGRLRSEPTWISNSALTRPLIQQTLLPVVAQVSGPAEGSYMAQVLPLIESLELPPPLIWPRLHATILSARDLDHANTDGIDEDLILHPDRWPSISGPGDRSAAVDALKQSWRSALDDVELLKQGEDLHRALGSVLDRAIKEVDRVQGKIESRENADLRRRREALRETIAPRDRDQERVLTPLSFGGRKDLGFWRKILASADPLRRHHRLIVLGRGEDAS